MTRKKVISEHAVIFDYRNQRLNGRVWKSPESQESQGVLAQPTGCLNTTGGGFEFTRKR